MPNSFRTPKNSRASSSTNSRSDDLNASLNRKKKYQSLLQKGVLLSKWLAIFSPFIFVVNFFISSDERVENTECTSTLAQVKSLIDNSNKISKENHASTEPNSNTTTITNASENVMDAALMKIGHEIVGIVANKLGHSEFSENVYAGKVLGSISEGNVINWSLFAAKILHIVKIPRFSQPTLGTFNHQSDPVTKAKKERIVRRKATIAEMKRPEKVTTLQKEEKGAQLLSIVKAQIEKEYLRRRHTPIPYYELILDPDDFMHTIDNAFQVAFLLRDGFVGLALDGNDDPLVYVPTKEQMKLKESDKKTTQAVVGINYAKWLEVRDRFGQSGEPILKLDRAEFMSQSQATPSQATQRRWRILWSFR